MNLREKNSITVDFDTAVDLGKLAGQYVYVDNDKVQNGAYKIHDATVNSDGNVVLDIDDVTLIRQYKVLSNVNSGYTYNIAEGHDFSIPFSTESDD